MSPEQALAKRITVDHRTDIYSLGITLYELLALQPAFNGADREEVLRQIAFEDPTPLRRRKPAIPVELETIIHKAIAKNPDDRYATARDFADDLARFCSDRPIRAKPPTRVERTLRWSRRHVAVVWSAAAVCLVLATVLAVATALVLDERTHTAEALTKAQTSAHLAKEAIDDIFVEFTDQRVPYGIAVTQREKTLLDKAARYYDRLMTEVGDNDASVGAITTLVHIAETHYAWGDGDRGKNEAQRAVALAESLLATEPDSHEAQAVLAKALAMLRLVSSANDPSLGKRITDLWESVSIARPNDLYARASLAEAWVHVAALHHAHQNYSEADKWGGWAYEAICRLLEDNPDNFELKKQAHDVMGVYAGLQMESVRQGDPDVRPGRLQLCQRVKRETIELARALVKESPYSAECQGRLGKSLMNSESIFDNAESIEHLRESIEIWQRLSTQIPEFRGFSNCLSFAYPQIQRCLLAEGQLAAYVEVLRDEIDFYNNSLGRTRDRVRRANLESSTAHRYQLIALLFNRLGQESDSRLAIETGLAFLERALTELNDRRDNSAPESELSERQVVLQCLAEMSWQLRRHTEAASYAERFISESRQHIARYPESANVRRRLAWFLASWPDDGLRNPDEAVSQAQEALKRSATTQEKGLAARALNIAHLRKGNWDECIAGADESEASDCLAAAIAYWRKSKSAEANRSYVRGISLMKKQFEFVVTRRFGVEQLRAEAEQLLGISTESGKTEVSATEAEK
jgi:tetratricopeptide (TPR) repeat protein